MNSPIKSIFEFVVSIQMLCMVVFLGLLLDGSLNPNVPIVIQLSSDYKIEFNFQFNYVTIILFLIALVTIYVLSGIKVLDSGLSDSSNNSLKQFLAFFSRFWLLQAPVIFLLSQSSFTYSLTAWITMFILVIHLLNYLNKNSEEKD